MDFKNWSNEKFILVSYISDIKLLTKKKISNYNGITGSANLNDCVNKSGGKTKSRTSICDL